MTDRRQALRDYLIEIAKDLVRRGVVRRANGQTLEDVVRTEPRAVLQQMTEDLVVVGTELGAGLALGLGSMLGTRIDGPAGEIVSGLGRAAANFLSGLAKKKGG